jgi:hypothetical protein
MRGLVSCLRNVGSYLLLFWFYACSAQPVHFVLIIAGVIATSGCSATDSVPPPGPVPRAGLPDFQVVEMSITAGRLTFWLINRGDATWPAGQTLDYVVQLPGQTPYRQTFRLPSDLVPIPPYYLWRGPPYPPEHLMAVELASLVIPCGVRNFTIIVNPDRLIQELDYANNHFHQEYLLTPPGSCGPRLKLTHGQIVSLPSPGSSYWLARLWIKNLGNAMVSQMDIAASAYGVVFAAPGTQGVPPNFNYRITSVQDYNPITVPATLQPGETGLVDVFLPVVGLPGGFPNCSIVAAQIVGVPGVYPQPPIEWPHRVWVFPAQWNGMSGDGGVIPSNYPNARGCVGIAPPTPVPHPER